MNAASTPAYEWKDLPWKQFERQVFKLQERIYRASRRGDVKTVHRLQRLLMSSWAAKCLAVRRVTQDNRGKQTAGVDGVKALTPPQRFLLTRTLVPGPRAKPVRRVWIPKPGKAEQRPLGIPTMRDRAAQTLVRLALEPEWEARFEPNSYGFRPGRSCHDAIGAIFTVLCRQPKYVLDADIAACFDRIDHSTLLAKLRTFPALRRVISGWLKAGVLDGVELSPTDEGTPQGGALSPLLANVALHGLEDGIRAAFPTSIKVQGRQMRWKPIVVRYADDFVILHQDRGVIEQARRVAEQWLTGMGLALQPSKSRIVHTLHSHEGQEPGFDFLGFNVRQYPVGKAQSGRDRYGHVLGFKTLIKPSRSAQKRHLARLAEVVRGNQQLEQGKLIHLLNRKIIGWANYYSSVVSKEVFSRLDFLVYAKLKRWAERRHSQKGHKWVARRYWHAHGLRQWVFKTRNGPELAFHADTPIVRHVKVEGARSLFDGDWAYWGTRLGCHPELSRGRADLLKRQKGRCAWCGLVFTRMDELIESDHILPRSLGGGDGRGNRQLLHGHCHDAKTATDGSNRHRSSGVPMPRAKDRSRLET